MSLTQYYFELIENYSIHCNIIQFQVNEFGI